MTTYKAISLWQPHASLIAIGEKTYETRHWSTKYRGPIAIHAAKTQDEVKTVWKNIQAHKAHPDVFPMGFTRATYDAFKAWMDREGLATWNFGMLPYGAIVATADLTAVYDAAQLLPKLTGRAKWFGDFGQGRYAWRLENVQMLPEPIPMRGQQGFWTVEL